MSDAVPPNQAEPQGERPSIVALFGQLSDDATSFVKAEADYVRAQVGERTTFAKPALALIGAGIALFFGLTMAAPVGLMLVLVPLIGPGWAFGSVMLGGALFAYLSLKFGTRRFKAALKRPEER